MSRLCKHCRREYAVEFDLCERCWNVAVKALLMKRKVKRDKRWWRNR